MVPAGFGLATCNIFVTLSDPQKSGITFRYFHIFNIPALHTFGILLSNLQPPSDEKMVLRHADHGARNMPHAQSPELAIRVFCLYGCVCPSYDP